VLIGIVHVLNDISANHEANAHLRLQLLGL
jgi:hypothetical protein